MKWYYWLLIAIVVAGVGYGAYYMLKEDKPSEEPKK